MVTVLLALVLQDGDPVRTELAFLPDCCRARLETHPGRNDPRIAKELRARLAWLQSGLRGVPHDSPVLDRAAEYVELLVDSLLRSLPPGPEEKDLLTRQLHDLMDVVEALVQPHLPLERREVALEIVRFQREHLLKLFVGTGGMNLPRALNAGEQEAIARRLRVTAVEHPVPVDVGNAKDVWGYFRERKGPSILEWLVEGVLHDALLRIREREIGLEELDRRWEAYTRAVHATSEKPGEERDSKADAPARPPRLREVEAEPGVAEKTQRSRAVRTKAPILLVLLIGAAVVWIVLRPLRPFRRSGTSSPQ